VSAPGLIVAAPASGSGKTVVTLGLMRSLRDAGLAVAPFKVGPDYIDPAFHAAACGRDTTNLDCWAMRPATLDGLAAGLSEAADIVVGEGVMGLFDGLGDGTGSTADLAARFAWPVVLVVDVDAQAESAAAVVGGFARHRDDVSIAGVIFNRVAGPAHKALLRRACEAAALPPVLGAVPRDSRLAVAERHLGLVQAVEHADLALLIEAAAAVVGAAIDREALIAAARRARGLDAAPSPTPLPPLGSRIAVAFDPAFTFAYPWLIEGWRTAGAEIVVFSPLADEAPDLAADAVYLPGGYPELHAGRLAAAPNFLGGLRAAAQRGATVYGECGGYMVLGRGLIDREGKRHAMAGLAPLETSFAGGRPALGYRRVTARRETPLGPAGSRFRGHEFHAAEILAEGGERLFDCAAASGRALAPTGHAGGNVFGSFVHLLDREAG